MTNDRKVPNWARSIKKGGGPVYLAIANAISAEIAAGRLAAGTCLPAQRALAELLGLDFTTVSRAYTELQRRGLTHGRVGQGTYVREARTAPAQTNEAVDMGMNQPPLFDDAGLWARMWDGIAELQRSAGPSLLLRYRETAGTGADRLVGAQWLSRRLPSVSADNMILCPGAQGALLAVTSVLAAPGDTICAESLTYPGFRSLAAHLRIRLLELPMDAQGIDPEAFERICRTEKPKALYCVPTLHNPTTVTQSLQRRKALVAVARQFGVPIIEDDAYGALPRAPLPPLAALAPEIVFHIAGLSKCLSPALRIAYLAAPDGRSASRITAALRASTLIVSPLNAMIASRWIESGIADEVLAAIREETHARQAIAANLLPADAVRTDAEGFHLWLSLSEPWTRGEFAERLRSSRVGVVASDAFALGHAPQAVRLGLGAAATRDELRRGLSIVADVLEQSPAMSSMVV
jgi:DNA-binding transcriptional MocR family regulator